MALELLLVDCFSPDELRRWVAHKLPTISDLLPGEIASRAYLARRVVELLERNDLLDANLFVALTAERGPRARDIEIVQATLTGTTRTPGRRLRHVGLAQADEHDQRCRAALLERIRKTWIGDYLEQSLHNLPWIDLETRNRADLVPHPASHPPPRSSNVEQGTIADAYTSAHGNLLILGDPGAGKTIALLMEARSQLDAAAQDDRQPLPVIFLSPAVSVPPPTPQRSPG